MWAAPYPGNQPVGSELRLWSGDRDGATLAGMHPTGVARALSVFATAPSKAPFYVAGGLLAGWAVLLGLTGLRYPEFPGSEGRARLVMLTTGLLVAATVTAAVTTAGTEGEGASSSAAGTAQRSGSVQLTADPTGQLAYDTKRATVRRGKFTLRLINRSKTPHNVTIAKGAKVVARTKTIQGATTSASANLPPGDYAFFCSVDAHRQAGMQGTLTVR
jgi:plastocyanin